MPSSRDILDQLTSLAHRTTIERNRGQGLDFIAGRRARAKLHDIGGARELIDCTCSGGVHNLGHTNPEVVAALKDALEAGLDGGIWFLPNRSALDIACVFERVMPPRFPNRAVITHSSTASIDLAIMIALKVTGRQRILACKNAYHGHTGFAAIVSDSAEEGVAGHYNLPRDMARFFEFGDTADLLACLDSSIAAAILEPMCYETFEPADPAFMAALYRLCREQGALVILDETRTGLGRTGVLWAAETYAGVPDIMIVGKGLSGGIYPVSACLMTDERYQSCINSHAYGYASSLGGNELACTVAVKVLEMSSRPALVANVAERAHQAGEAIDALSRRYQGVVIGGHAYGLAIGIRLVSDAFASSVYRACVEAGLLCHSMSHARGPMIKLMPPLIVDAETLAEIFSRLDTAIAHVLVHETTTPPAERA
jgi:acetylornithine aminotransferase